MERTNRDDQMRVLTLNLFGVGPASDTTKRGGIEEIVEYLLHSDSDVLVLTEFKSGKGSALFLKALFSAGYRWTSTSRVTSMNPLGVAVFSRMDADSVRLSLPDTIDQAKIAALNVKGITIVGIYNNPVRQHVLFKDYLLLPPPELAEYSLLIGDCNTCCRYLDQEADKPLPGEEEFKKMPEHGWIDLWRKQHGKRREFTWFSHPHNNGFRVDHAFATEPVARIVTDCHYDHGTRSMKAGRPRLSDHSAMIVALG